MSPMLKNFLTAQHEQARSIQALNADKVVFLPSNSAPPQRYVVAFLGSSLVKDAQGPRIHRGEFHIGIRFPDDYLLRAEASTVLTWLHPRAIFHPNIFPEAGAICLRITAGMPLIEIVHTLYDAIHFYRFATASALNPEAAQFVRRHADMFPIKAPPLRRVSANSAPELASAAKGETHES